MVESPVQLANESFSLVGGVTTATNGKIREEAAYAIIAAGALEVQKAAPIDSVAGKFLLGLLIEYAIEEGGKKHPAYLMLVQFSETLAGSEHYESQEE